MTTRPKSFEFRPTGDPVAQRWLAQEYWRLHLQAYNANASGMALTAYRAHFDAVERVARATRPDLWIGQGVGP